MSTKSRSGRWTGRAARFLISSLLTIFGLVDVRLIPFPHGEHSFDQMSGSIGSQLVREATLRFLARHGVAP